MDMLRMWQGYIGGHMRQAFKEILDKWAIYESDWSSISLYEQQDSTMVVVMVEGDYTRVAVFKRDEIWADLTVDNRDCDIVKRCSQWETIK